MFMQMLDKMPHGFVLALFLGGMGILCFAVIAVTGIVFSHWGAVRQARLEGELKLDMLARGLSAEDIERVIKVSASQAAEKPQGTDVPGALDVVVESDGDWYPALVMKRAGARWFVHYVGSDSDENEWVGEDRIRFPVRFFEQLAAAGEGPAGPWEAAPRKPEGVGVDL